MTKQIYSILIFFLMFCASSISVGQQSDFTTPKNASKKTKESYKKAYSYILQRDYNAAIKEFSKLIRKDPKFVNSYIQMGYIYESHKDFDKAEGFFNKALELAPDYNPKIYLALGRIAMNKKDYPEVDKQLSKFLSYDKLHPNLIKIATKRLGDARFIPKAIKNPVKFEPLNLGENINSENREYFPSVTLEEELVYTVLFGKGNQGQEDLFMSRKSDSVWSKGRGISAVNTDDNEGAQSISADGKFLVYTVCNRKEDYGSCDLYFSRKINNKWTAPENIGSPVNSAEWESQPSISPNGDAIYFVRGGTRGQGHKDLFITKLQEDGTWGTPENIEELNTLDNESSPCLHPDGKTLYFSSDGYPGMGGFDLYVSRKVDGKWTEPKNLGYPINTAGQEEALAVNRKGSIAYLASDREGGFGSLDIYGFKLPDFALPVPVTFVRGITLDAQKNAPLSAYVEIVNIKTKKVLAKIKTKKDGEFTLCMPVGEYALNAWRDGYLFFSANYSLTEVESLDKSFRLKANLQPLVFTQNDSMNIIREPIVLENVFFTTASFVLESDSRIELDKLKKLLDENPDMHIQLNGHTDNVGKPEDNLVLSDNRAKAVVEYLIAEGIAADRLSAKGFGETKPRFGNDSETGRAGNRRTEFIVLSQ
jgi:outer membrane protein OmpA-like peptidoglycan-associated protein/tetratricopeptide (TPR) repeat protein